MLYVVVVKAANLECKEPSRTTVSSLFCLPVLLVLGSLLYLCVCAFSAHCDAYCVASVGQITRKTRTIENATSPAWNESLMGFKWNGSDPLLLRVFDRDNAAPEACGVACISLDGIPAAVDQTVSAPLHGVVSGQVTVEITFQKY
jgi:C2 domain